MARLRSVQDSRHFLMTLQVDTDANIEKIKFWHLSLSVENSKYDALGPQIAGLFDGCGVSGIEILDQLGSQWS